LSGLVLNALWLTIGVQAVHATFRYHSFDQRRSRSPSIRTASPTSRETKNGA
jgi:hypothetical protein